MVCLQKVLTKKILLLAVIFILCSVAENAHAQICDDSDSDGFDDCYIGDVGDDGLQFDCYDTDSSINPGATEICGNETDDNCSGFDLPCGATTTFPFTSSTPGPQRFPGGPIGALEAGTTNATLSLGTFPVATCKFDTMSGISYTNMSSTFSFTGGTSHTHTISGLVDGASYNYYVKCRDTDGIVNTTDHVITFQVEVAPLPPASTLPATTPPPTTSPTPPPTTSPTTPPTTSPPSPSPFVPTSPPSPSPSTPTPTAPAPTASTPSPSTPPTASTPSAPALCGGNFCNPLAFDTLPGFLHAVLQTLTVLLFPFIVLMIVYTGFLFVRAEGNPEKIKVARRALIWTVIGALVVLGSYAITVMLEATVASVTV